MPFDFQKMIGAVRTTGAFLLSHRAEAQLDGSVTVQRSKRYRLLPLTRIPRSWEGTCTMSIDTVAQEIALQALAPNRRIVSEDNNRSHRLISQGETYLALDSLDGTDMYLSTHSPDYGVMLGRVVRGQPRQGVIFLPARELLLEADLDCTFQRDKSAPTNSDGFVTNPYLSLKKRFVGVSLNAKNDPQLYHRGYERLRQKAAGVLSYGSNAAGFAALLYGHINAYICISGKRKNVWEFAAGDVITRMAGGVSSDYDGKPLAWNQPRVIGIWSASQALHEEILEVVLD